MVPENAVVMGNERKDLVNDMLAHAYSRSSMRRLGFVLCVLGGEYV